MSSHATLSDLTGWLPEGADLDTSDAPRLLARASELVDFHVRAPYALGDPAVAEVLRAATCAVVEAWLEVGEENDVDGLAGTQVSVAGYSGLRAPSLPPRAYRCLASAGLTQPSDTPGVAW